MSTITRPTANTAKPVSTSSSENATNATPTSPETSTTAKPEVASTPAPLGLHGLRDAFDSDETTSTNSRARPLPSSSGTGQPVGDASLSSALSSSRASANAGRITHRTAKEPVVSDGPTGTDAIAKKAEANQKAFCAEMKAAGIEASQPPTPEQLKAYFGTFNTDADRPKALDAYRRYSDAYHVHVGETRAMSKDVKYSSETHYAVNGKIVGTDKEAAEAKANAIRDRGKDVVFDKLPTKDASSWEDVTTNRKSDNNRHVNDCEGYAYTAQELLGAAGYKTEQVAVAGGPFGDHAMTVLKDPSRPREVHVASNGDVFAGKAGSRGESDTLNTAFKDAGGGLPAKYYRGATQAEAQARMQQTTLK
jgi:hypothetical protein